MMTNEKLAQTHAKVIPLAMSRTLTTLINVWLIFTPVYMLFMLPSVFASNSSLTGSYGREELLGNLDSIPLAVLNIVFSVLLLGWILQGHQLRMLTRSLLWLQIVSMAFGAVIASEVLLFNALGFSHTTGHGDWNYFPGLGPSLLFVLTYFSATYISMQARKASQ